MADNQDRRCMLPRPAPARPTRGTVFAIARVAGKDGTTVFRAGSLFADPEAIARAENENGLAELRAELAAQELAD